MNIWVLTEGYDREGEVVTGVAASLDAAKRLADREAPDPAGFLKWERISADAVSRSARRASAPDQQTIYRMRVEQ